MGTNSINMLGTWCCHACRDTFQCEYGKAYWGNAPDACGVQGCELNYRSQISVRCFSQVVHWSIPQRHFTVHPPLIDVLLRFRSYPVSLTADISKIEPLNWRREIVTCTALCGYQIQTDHRMTLVTFGVSAFSFAANMAVKQNATEYGQEFPLATDAAQVFLGWWLFDRLRVRSDSATTANGSVFPWWILTQNVEYQRTLHIQKDSQGTPRHRPSLKSTSTPRRSVSNGTYQLTDFTSPLLNCHWTKRVIVSDVAKVFDVLAYCTVKMTILLQRLWDAKIDWDDPTPDNLLPAWSQWRSELSLLTTLHVPRCYFSTTCTALSTQLHGFSDASEDTYGGVIFLPVKDSTKKVHTALVISKPKFPQWNGCQYPDWNYVEPEFSPSYLSTRSEYSTFLWFLSSWDGCLVVREDSRRSSASESPPSSINFLPSNGDTFLVLRMKPTVHQKVYFPLNWSHTSSGGKDLLGCN